MITAAHTIIITKKLWPSAGYSMMPPVIAGTGTAVCSPRKALSLTTGGDMTGRGVGSGTTISAFNSACCRK